jgi:hypothetical protein
MFQTMNRATAFLILSLLSFSPLVMAQAISPQVGTWTINQENSGKPGRGFQIEVQNDILVLYFYGYEPTGDSIYWLATGRLPAGSNELTVDLGEYEGGMAFGDAAKNAVYRGSRGQVTIRFSTIAKGQICLPEETCKDISPFNFGFENNVSRLLGVWVITTTDSTTKALGAYEFHLTEIRPASDTFSVDRALGWARVESLDGKFEETEVACSKTDKGPARYYCRAGDFGFEQDFEFDIDRNAIAGEFYDSSGVNGKGTFVGFRVTNQSGRSVIPN